MQTGIFLVFGALLCGVESKTVREDKSQSILPSLSCVLDCGVQFGDGWREVFSENEEGKLISDSLAQGKLLQYLIEHTRNLTGQDQKDTFLKICSVYVEYNGCLGKCPQNLVSKTIRTGLDSLQSLCGAKRQDYFDSIPCLGEKRERLVKKCRSQEERVTLSALVLHSSFVQSPRNLLAALTDFCGSALNHSKCVYPVVAECGVGAGEMIQGVWRESFSAVDRILSRVKIPLPPLCSQALLSLSPQPTNTKASTKPLQTQISSPSLPKDKKTPSLPVPMSLKEVEPLRSTVSTPSMATPMPTEPEATPMPTTKFTPKRYSTPLASLDNVVAEGIKIEMVSNAPESKVVSLFLLTLTVFCSFVVFGQDLII